MDHQRASDEHQRREVFFAGRVQGVGFRYSTQREARRLGLSGWVRNRRDGTVEITAQGDEKILQTFLAWCRKGPSHAGVSSVDESWPAVTSAYREFAITETV